MAQTISIPTPTRPRGRVQMRLHYDGEWTDGLHLVERLLIGGHRPRGDLDRQTAESAIEALALLELPWIVGEMIEGGEGLAEQVHSEATRGLQEVVQNAQDQGAKHIRFAWRRLGRRAELLIAHDGDPVELYDVVSMALPLLSGSRSDAEKIGRFGIGLKTLNQFGDRLGVHCPPLPGFVIRGGHIDRVPDAKALPGFWDPTKRETLFALHLKHPRFNLAFFRDWIERWDVSSLIFLDRLHSVALVDLRSRKPIIERALTTRKTSEIDLPFPRARNAERVELRDVGSSRRWARYRVRYPVPREITRINKALGETVELAVAACNRPGGSRLYAGLPLDEPSTLPFSVSAPFDIDLDRTALLDNSALNEWLFARLGELAAAAAEDAFKRRARDGWGWVPLASEHAGQRDSWLRGQVEPMTARVRERVAARVRLSAVNGDGVKLADFLIEAPALEKLLGAEDIERLDAERQPRWRHERSPKRALPSHSRDGGRWRDVLGAISGPRRLEVGDTLACLDWSDEEILPRGTTWLVAFLGAAIDAHEQDSLLARRCLLVEGSDERHAPSAVAASGRTLVISLPDAGLAASLGLAERVVGAFRARNDSAREVRRWLTDVGVLHEKPSDAALLEALAAADGGSPIDLSGQPDLVKRLRNSFEQLPADRRDELGPGIGRNIKLAGFEYDKKGNRQGFAVAPTEAYIPYRIEKVEGWPTAAGKTPGIRWVDERYGDWLKTGRDTASAVKRQGALAFLRSIGAAVAPRLHAGLKENPDPYATLHNGRLPAQQRDDLVLYPKAQTLRRDFDSSDLAAALADITSKRTTVKERRKRARALFQCLSRAWSQQYSGRDTAMAAHHYYRWHEDGLVSATWVGRLASEPWLSTREGKFTPKAPRELAILTDASYEIEGARPGRYTFELNQDDLESPVVAVIGIEGKPTVDTIFAKLEVLRDEERAGQEMQQSWADQCYQALSAYCPGGRYESDSDLMRAQWRARFGTTSGKPGLIRVAGSWHSIPDVRRGAYLGELVPWVEKPQGLWEHLDIPSTSVADCAHILCALADENANDLATEIRVTRRLVELASSSRGLRKQLVGVPLHTYRGWITRRPAYAVRDAALAQAVGEHWPVWRAPISLDEAALLLVPLGLTVVGEDAFSPDVPSAAIAATDLQVDFPAIVTHLKNYLTLHNPDLHGRLSASQWQALLETKVALGDGWAVRVRAPRRRTLRITPRAHLFRDPLLFCAFDDDEAQHREAGGRAIASYFLGDALNEQDRAFLTLAWESAFRRRHERDEEIDLGTPVTENDANAAPMPSWLANRQAGKNIRRRRIKPQPQRVKAEPRELVNLDELDLSAIKATMVATGRTGKFRSPAPKPLTTPTRISTSGSSAARSSAGNTLYSPVEREDTGFAVIAACLRESYGLSLEDIRSQGDVGADAVDHDQDIWVEMKAHGRERPDTVSLQASEAKRAKEKGNRYWLAVVWNLEKPRTPELLVVQNPLAKLDTYLGSGIKLAGLDDIT
jgi:hypothetical protein